MRHIFQLFLLIVFVPSLLLADNNKSSPYYSQLSGDLKALIASLVDRRLPHFAKQSLLKPVKLRLVAGKRIYNVSFDRVEPALWRSYFNNGFTKEEDPTHLTLFSGVANNRGEKFRAGATLKRLHGKTVLEVYFQPASVGKPRMLYARIPLNNGSLEAQGVYSLRPFHAPIDGYCSATGKSVAHTEALTQPNTSAAVLPLFEIAMDADAQFFQIHGENTNSVLATIINQLNVVYESDLGLHAEIIEQNTFTNPSAQPYTSTKALVLLDQFQAYRTQVDPFVRYDVAHLMTGKELQGNSIGIAAVGSVCVIPGDSFGLSQYVRTVADTAITVMHEIGHNFSATHTNSGIMFPAATTPPPTNFSTFSVSEIASFVSQNGSCLGECVGCPPPDLSNPFEEAITAINEIILMLGAVVVPPNEATPELLDQYVQEITTIETVWLEAGTPLLEHFVKKVRGTAKKIGKTFPKAKTAKKSKSKERKIKKLVKLLNKVLGLLSFPG